MAMIMGKGEGSGEHFIDDLKGFKCFCLRFCSAIQMAWFIKVTPIR
jgi:hypothetical protein